MAVCGQIQRCSPKKIFIEFLEYAKEKEAELKAEMADGHAETAPYEFGGSTGCDYCPYRDICGFDTRIAGCTYRTLEKYSTEEVMEKIRRASN